MSWGTLIATQMVSEGEAATSPFQLMPGQSQGSGTLCMTKLAATTRYSLLASNLTGYASNQLIPKSVWAAPVVYYSYTLGINWDGSGYLYTDYSDGNCTYNNIYDTYYSSSSTIVTSMTFYRDNTLTSPLDWAFTYYHAASNQLLAINNVGVVTTISDCTPAYYTYNFDTTGYTTDLNSCLSAGSGLTLYSADAWITLNVTQLFTDAALTTALNGLNRWWYLGADAATYEIDGDGYTLSQAGC